VALLPKLCWFVQFTALLQVFVESLVVGGPRQLMLMEAEVQRGPYKAGQPATHMGKILYPQCRKTGVWCVCRSCEGRTAGWLMPVADEDAGLTLILYFRSV
jgi:hypothetical protein